MFFQTATDERSTAVTAERQRPPTPSTPARPLLSIAANTATGSLTSPRLARVLACVITAPLTSTRNALAGARAAVVS